MFGQSKGKHANIQLLKKKVCRSLLCSEVLLQIISLGKEKTKQNK